MTLVFIELVVVENSSFGYINRIYIEYMCICVYMCVCISVCLCVTL